MKYNILIITALVCSGYGNSWAESKLPIQPVVLVNLGRGTGMGQISFDPYEPLTLPGSFLIDEHENAYILDKGNNRVLHYDGSGKYIEAISIQSFEAPTEELKRYYRGHAPYSTTVDNIDLIDGVIYAIQRKLRAGKVPEQHILRMQGGDFINVDSAMNSKALLKTLSGSYREEQQNRRLAGQFSKSGLSRQVAEKDGPAKDVAIDSARNVWVIYPVNSIRVYTPKGELISEIKDHRLADAVSKQGNLYTLNLCSKKLGVLTNFDDLDLNVIDGICLLKYSLQENNALQVFAPMHAGLTP